MPVTTTLPWDVLAALPETYLTAQGSLDALGVVPGGQGRLLIRGGTSSVGMAAASIASGYGVKTAATTRRQDRTGALTAAGVDHPLVDAGGSLAASVHAVWPEGPDYILDLVGTSTAVDSLHLVRRGGTVCMTGTLSGWTIPDFEPVATIPAGTRLTAFHSDNFKGSAGTTVLQRVVHEVEAGLYQPNLDRVFALDDIVAAHRYMENNQATGKLVVLPEPPGNSHRASPKPSKKPAVRPSGCAPARRNFLVWQFIVISPCSQEASMMTGAQYRCSLSDGHATQDSWNHHRRTEGP